MKWTAEEDAIILRERENRVKYYADRAVVYLEGRSAAAVRNRWNKYLKHHHAADAPDEDEDENDEDYISDLEDEVDMNDDDNG